jgi:hypothetical protein
VGESLKNTGVLANIDGKLACGNEAEIYDDGTLFIFDESDCSVYPYNIQSSLTMNPALDDGASGSGGFAELVTKLGNSYHYHDLFGFEAGVAHYGAGAVEKVTSFNAWLHNSQSGKITKAIGIEVYIHNGLSASEITTAYGILIKTPDYTNPGEGTIGTAYGLYVETQKGTATTDYNIYSAGYTSKNKFEGKMNLALSAHVNNAAALLGGLVAGDLYRTGGDPDVICVVH